MSPQMQITVAEFKRRLESLCLRSGGRDLPRKRRDQHILFKSVIMLLASDRKYSESELNQTLEKWLADVGQAVDIDYVSLRRHLVDEGYLTRDRAGLSYRVSSAGMADFFEPTIDTLDPVAVIEEALIQVEQKKLRYLERPQHKQSTE